MKKLTIKTKSFNWKIFIISLVLILISGSLIYYVTRPVSKAKINEALKSVEIEKKGSVKIVSPLKVSGGVEDDKDAINNCYNSIILAKYVITHNKKDIPVLLSYRNKSKKASTLIAESVLVVDKIRYTIRVFNEDGSFSLDIWQRPKGTHKDKYLSQFTDVGLNGTCDYGMFSDKKEDYYGIEKKGVKKSGLNLKALAQSRFEVCVKDILMWYMVKSDIYYNKRRMK